MTVTTGDPAPWFHARSPEMARCALDSFAGRYLALTFVRSGADPAASDVLRQVAALEIFNDARAALFIVTADPRRAEAQGLPLRLPGVRAFFDDDGSIGKAYGSERFGGSVGSVVISPRLQVLGILVGNDPQGHAAHLKMFLERMPAPDRLPEALAQAPLLVVPGILEPELCQRLIEGHRQHVDAQRAPMRDRGPRAGRPVGPAEARSHWDIGDGDLKLTLQQRFIGRVVPEIKRAFQFDVTRMDRYLVACDVAGAGDTARPHRDNATKSTAHRRFAVTLNLNEHEHDGGDLRLLEFGQRTYRAPTGGGLVFSCSLLHETTPVTRGQRYAFLPFLYDEAARRVRDANAAIAEPAPPTGPQKAERSPNGGAGARHASAEASDPGEVKVRS